jgi:hypothetical protein
VVLWSCKDRNDWEVVGCMFVCLLERSIIDKLRVCFYPVLTPDNEEINHIGNSGMVRFLLIKFRYAVWPNWFGSTVMSDLN